MSIIIKFKGPLGSGKTLISNFVQEFLCKHPELNVSKPHISTIGTEDFCDDLHVEINDFEKFVECNKIGDNDEISEKS